MAARRLSVLVVGLSLAWVAGCVESEDIPPGSTTGAAGTTGLPVMTGAAGTSAPTTGAAGTSAPTTGAAGTSAPTTGAAGTSAPTTGAAGTSVPTTGAAGTSGAAGTMGAAGRMGTDGGTIADAGADGGGLAPTFTNIYNLILGPTPMVAASSCAGATCHRDPGGGTGLQHINMNTKAMAYTGVKKFVVVGNAAGSKMFTEVNTGAMPMMKPKLPAALITMISDWIKAGALDN